MKRMTRVNMKWEMTDYPEVEVDNAILWCKDRFGSCMYGNPKWNYVGMGTFEFRDEEEAVFFALRWL